MRFLNLLLLIGLLFAGTARLQAQTAEADAFAAAARSFQDHFYDRAAREMAEFVTAHPGSARVSEARLLRVQALCQLKKWDDALAEVDRASAAAGPLADQFALWRAQCLFEKGQFKPSAESFGRILVDHPQSPARLDAAYGEALSVFRLGDHARAITLLQNPESPFPKTLASVTNEPVAIKGGLLLAEALIALKKWDEARAALTQLSARKPSGEMEWERLRMLANVETEVGRSAEAVAAWNAAVGVAQAVKRPDLLAASWGSLATLHQKMGNPALAVASLDQLTAGEGVSPAVRRESLLKIATMLTGVGQSTNAISRLQAWLAQNPQDPAADEVHFMAGTLLMAQFREIKQGADAARTNLLAQARLNFDALVSRWTNSPLLGRSFLARGWIGWEQAGFPGQSQELGRSLADFQAASTHIPPSPMQAEARAKAGDVLFLQGQYGAASGEFEKFAKDFSADEVVRTNLLPHVYEQWVRSKVGETNYPAAREVLSGLLKLAPGGPVAGRTLSFLAHTLMAAGKVSEARDLVMANAAAFTDENLQADLTLLVANSYVRERSWEKALQQYDTWVGRHTNHPALPQAEFERARLNHQAGLETNAFQQFTNFVATRPNHPLASRAQMWVGDYYDRMEQWTLAEQSYQKLFQNTNWAASDLAWEAKLRAAQTASKRQGYSDERAYLTNMVSDPACPTNIAPAAWFLLGLVVIEQRTDLSTNTLGNFAEALNAFERIPKNYPGSEYESAAWGKIGDCHLQLLTLYKDSYDKATNAYRKVLDAGPAVPVALRNLAQCGLGTTYEKASEDRPPAEKNALLRLAMEQFLNVVYASGPDAADPYWLKRAALNAGRLAEALGETRAAAELYRRMIKQLPALAATWEAKLKALEAATGT